MDLDPHYLLIVMYSHLNNTPTRVMTVRRLTIKGQKVGGGPIPGNPSFPRIVGIILPPISLFEASLVTQIVKNLPAIQRHLGSVPGSGRSPGEGNGPRSSILAWKIPWTEELVLSP